MVRRCKYPEHEFLSTKERVKSNSARYKAKHPEKVRSRKIYNQRIYSLRNKFNMTLAQYAELLKSQDGHCAICPNKPRGTDSYRGGKNLAVDHNHTTNINRGLLCDKCNRGLGHFNDDPNLLLRAVEYLRKYDGVEEK